LADFYRQLSINVKEFIDSKRENIQQIKTYWVLRYFHPDESATGDWSMAYGIVEDGIQKELDFMKEFPTYTAKWMQYTIEDGNNDTLLKTIPFDGSIPDEIKNDPSIQRDIEQAREAKEFEQENGDEQEKGKLQRVK
jgi:hypothetical protein